MGSHQLHRRHPPRRSCPRRRKQRMDLTKVLPQSRRPCRIRVIGQNVLVAERSLALSRVVSVALARSRRGVGRDVRLRRPLLCWRARAADGSHHIGRIAPDRLGLNLPDRGFRLIVNKPRLGAGRPSSPCHCRRLSTGVYRRPALRAPALPAPVRQGPVGDAPPVFIGARRVVLRQCGSMTPGVVVGVLQH